MHEVAKSVFEGPLNIISNWPLQTIDTVTFKSKKSGAPFN